jgi:hypothetical protein
MISGFVKDSFMNVAIWLSLFKYCRIEFSCDYWYMIKCLYSFRLIYFYSYNLVGLYLVIYKFCLRNVVYNVLFEWFHLHTKNSMLLSNPFIAVLLQLNCRLSTVLAWTGVQMEAPCSVDIQTVLSEFGVLAVFS